MQNGVSDELKACPRCGQLPEVYEYDNNVGVGCINPKCPDRENPMYNLDEWQSRPIEDALNNRIAELEAQLRWIPVSEKPTESDFYLVRYNGYRVPDTSYYDVDEDWYAEDPDYWMPIIELPEDTNEPA